MKSKNKKDDLHIYEDRSPEIGDVIIKDNKKYTVLHVSSWIDTSLDVQEILCDTGKFHWSGKRLYFTINDEIDFHKTKGLKLYLSKIC